MKLAILGTDSEILQLLAAARRDHHEIVWLGDVRPEDAASLYSLAPRQLDRGGEWELLLGRGVFDAVLVGRGTASYDTRANQIKRLATEEVPLLIVYPLFESVLTYYEIDMTRRETAAIVQHYNPYIGSPFIPEIAGWIHDGHPTIGQIHQLSCERQVSSASRDGVLKYLARDVELLALVAGDIRRVTAIGPSANAPSFASLQIQMLSSIAPSLHWSVSYASAGYPRLDLAFHGEHGQVRVRICDGAKESSPTWEIASDNHSAQNFSELDTFDPAGNAIRRLAEAISNSPAIVDRIRNATWDAATRAMEVIDAVELSLQKGRTIEVFQQQLTEQLAFRGTMAAMGCGLLLIAFLVLVGVGLLGGAEGIGRKHLVNSWSLVLLALLAFFLVLQAVPMLAGKGNRESRDPTAKPTSESSS